jgi:hypothetical protein
MQQAAKTEKEYINWLCNAVFEHVKQVYSYCCHNISRINDLPEQKQKTEKNKFRSSVITMLKPLEHKYPIDMMLRSNVNTNREQLEAYIANITEIAEIEL